MRKPNPKIVGILAATLIILAIAEISEAGFEGTIGMTFTISGSGFGTNKPHVYVQYANRSVKATVLDWSNTHIAFLWTKKLPPGTYDLMVKTKGNDPIAADSLKIMKPQINSFVPNSATVGDNITVHGSFFTSKKVKIYIEDPLSLKRKKAKVSRITMDPVTGTSSLQFVMPDLQAGELTQYNLILENTIGKTTARFPRSDTTEISGTVSPPGLVPLTSLTVISPFTASVVSSEGNYTAKVYGEGVSIVAAMPTEKEFGLMNVVAMLPAYNPSAQFARVGKRVAAAYSASSSTIDLNAMTTAVSMVFVTPYFLTNDPTKAADIIAIIENDPKVQLLGSVVDTVFGEDDPLANPTLQEALINAVQSVLDTMSTQAAMVSEIKGVSHPGILELPRIDAYAESLGFSTYCADLDYVTVNVQWLPSWYDVCIESKWTGSVDWIGEIMELDKSQFASLSDLQLKATNNRMVYQGEGNLWHDWVSAPAKGFFSYFDIIDKAFDWASEALFGSSLKDCAAVATDQDGIYLIRAYSGGGWLNLVDDGERTFVRTQIPNGDRMNNWALGYNISTCVFDALSAFAAFDKLFSEELNEIALAGWEKAAEKIEWVVGNPSPTLRDLISVSSDVTEAMLSKLAEIALEEIHKSLFKFLGRSVAMVGKSVVNIGTLNSILKGAKVVDRVGQLLFSTTPMETAMVVVGNPFDTSAPSIPTGLKATPISSAQIDLSWKSSTDNVGVTGYKIFRDGTYLRSVSSTSTSDTGLNSATEYCYTVSAYDAASNESGQSKQACAVTDTVVAPPNQTPVAEAAVATNSGGPYYGYNTPLTVTKGQAVNLYFFADKDVNGDSLASLDPDGWTDADNGVSSGGKCEWNTDLNQGTPTFEQTISNPASASACNIGPRSYTFNDPAGTYEYQVLRITDRKGAQSVVSKIKVTVTSTSEVIIDDQSSGFSKYGTPSYWHEASIGYNSHMFWTYNNQYTIDNYAKWQPNLSTGGPGTYAVYAYIPNNYATTTNATYTIFHNGVTDTKIINQNIYYNEWVLLGSFYFSANGSEYVQLVDKTGETAVTKMIGFDAMKWVK